MKKNIESILVPTDFGALGQYAYSIAGYISEKTNADIHVISVVPGPAGAFYSHTGELMNDDANDYTEWLDKLQASKAKMKEWIGDKPKITETHSTIGVIDDCIVNYATNHGIDLIVMGTEGLFGSKIWNSPSHTEYISNHSPIPVLSLKCDRSEIDIKNILFAGDFLVAKMFDLHIIKSIQAIFNAQLKLLKVRLPDAIRTDQKIKSDMEEFALVNSLENYSTYIYNDQGVESGIGKFAAEEKIDLITLGTHQKSGFSKLFRGSVSDDVVNHLFHPVLTFPIT